MERQSHGFAFEQKYIYDNKLISTENYTDKFDAYDEFGIPYQIKCIKKGSSIDMGDFFRNASISKNFYLVVAFWDKQKDNIVEVNKLFIIANEWKNLFSGFTEYKELKKWILNVSNDYSYDKQWKKEIKQWKKIYGKRKIAIRFKRDHKKQKRIQCAINKTTFYSFFVKEFSIE